MRLSDWRRLWNSLSAGRVPAAPCDVLRPRYIPWLGIPGVHWLNKQWLLSQLAGLRSSGAATNVLWIGTPSILAEAAVESETADVVVYDCMDHYPAFHNDAGTRRRIERAERTIIDRAEVVFASSKNLVARLQELHPNVVLAPNGVDGHVFAPTVFANAPEWRRGVRSPVIGFYGSLGEWLDYALLESLAAARPQWTFVFIGPVTSPRARRLTGFQNVVHVKPVPYRDLPAHAAGFDVAVVPFELNELTRCVHPIKALEYLAAGLPTVSTRLPDLEELASVIGFAATLEDWIGAIEQSLNPDSRTAELVAARRAAVAGHSWDELTSRMVRCLQAAIRLKLDGADILKLPQSSSPLLLRRCAA
jgi:UDP-galactopyranose mutase